MMGEDIDQESAAPICNTEISLRRLLWLHHGCDSTQLTTRDGHMHCAACELNFKDAPPGLIQSRMLAKMRRDILAQLSKV